MNDATQTTIARKAGTCWDCGESIAVGDAIRRDEDGDACHVTCPPVQELTLAEVDEKYGNFAHREAHRDRY